MSSSGNSLNEPLSQKTSLLGLKIWVVIGIGVGAFIAFTLILLIIYFASQHKRKSRRASDSLPITQIPCVSKEINVVDMENVKASNSASNGTQLISHKSSEKQLGKTMVQTSMANTNQMESNGKFSPFENVCKNDIYLCGDDPERISVHKAVDSHYSTANSLLCGLPEFSHLGWGHWFTLRDLELATNHFSKENIIGEGGYGIVYQGCLINGAPVAIKKLLNNLGQAEREFRVEVDAIGHVRHKNLVRLLGYCVEGTQRMLIYEYVNNGNLEQWLHGEIPTQGSLTWEARIKVLLGTAKALAYLHEAIEPKVVHRDIKSSNILIDDEFNAKISDFGLAKLLGTGESHISTRVMGTFGYVAPEYASTGLLNEKSDIYSFGVVLLEAITGRDPVDYGRAAHEVNLVDWLKVMIGSRRSEEVLDPNIENRPSTKALKKNLLTALRCLDPVSEKRPKMSQVVQMMESNDQTLHEEERMRTSRSGNGEVESHRRNSDADKSGHPDPSIGSSRRKKPSSKK